MEARLFDPTDPPPWLDPDWYADRPTAPHLEQEGHRDRLLLTADFVADALKRSPGKRVIDLGAGDGGLLSLLGLSRDECWGYDLQPSNVEAAQARGIDVVLKDVVLEWFVNYPADDPIDVVITAEFLEHLLDPHEMVWRIADSGARYLVASSPYTETASSHYEFHTWAWDQAGYRTLLEDNGWRVIRQETAWISQVLLAERSPA